MVTTSKIDNQMRRGLLAKCWPGTGRGPIREIVATAGWWILPFAFVGAGIIALALKEVWL